MIEEARSRGVQESNAEALRTESGSEILTSWINGIQARGRIEYLFGFETWLRALIAFCDHRRLPLTVTQKACKATRDFSPEIRVMRQALCECESFGIQLCIRGQDEASPCDLQDEARLYSPRGMAAQGYRAAVQTSPAESLSEFLQSVHDMDALLLGLMEAPHQGFSAYLGFGRMLRREVGNAGYVDMLISQRLRVQYDRIENAVLRAAVRSISDEQVRGHVSHAVLYLFRQLRYLKLVQSAMESDQPLRRFLAIFALLHEQTEQLCDFLKTRFLRDKQRNLSLRRAAELMHHALKSDVQHAFDSELASVAAETDASIIYAKVENSHGLLCNCFQSGIVTLIQAFDDSIDAKALFPVLLEGVAHSQVLRKDLWDLREDLRSELQKGAGLDLGRILDRIGMFRESSLKYLMYQDCGEFERISESLITAGTEMETRILLRKFVSYLEMLIAEVSKRSVLQNRPL